MYQSSSLCAVARMMSLILQGLQEVMLRLHSTRILGETASLNKLSIQYLTVSLVISLTDSLVLIPHITSFSNDIDQYHTHKCNPIHTNSLPLWSTMNKLFVSLHVSASQTRWLARLWLYLQVPIVIRGPGGVGRQLGAEHSQRLESYFQSIPGVQLVACSTVANAKALLKSAIRSDNPIIFFEHVLLYNVKGSHHHSFTPSPTLCPVMCRIDKLQDKLCWSLCLCMTLRVMQLLRARPFVQVNDWWLRNSICWLATWSCLELFCKSIVNLLLFQICHLLAYFLVRWPYYVSNGILDVSALILLALNGDFI